jgi:tetratricopeptide (TPR) repeat protein
MNKSLVIYFLIILLAGCATGQVSHQNSNNSSSLDNSGLANSGMVYRVSDLSAKYGKMLPLLANDLTGVDPRFTEVIGLGKSLNTSTMNDSDELTISNDGFWIAFFSMSPDSPLIYMSRITLLIRDGYLQRARYGLLFAQYHADMKEQLSIFQNIMSDIDKVGDSVVPLIKKGITYHDAGRFQNAINLYKQALGIYPHSPWALYELGQTNMTMDFANGKYASFYSATRKADPFYLYAYQGSDKNVLSKMPILLSQINPAFDAIKKGDISKQNLLQFADGCQSIGVHEYAIYAYELSGRIEFAESHRMNDELSKKIVASLTALGATEAANWYLNQMAEISKTLQ